MRRIFLLVGAAGMLLSHPAWSFGQDRYAEAPPLVVSPDLSAPWVMQLHRAPDGSVVQYRPAPVGVERYSVQRRTERFPAPPQVERGLVERRTAAIMPMYTEKQMRQPLAPQFLPHVVDYRTPQKPGTIVIDTRQKFLYLVEPGGKAMRYGVGVGKEGFGWRGTNLITRKAEWPGWTPPAEMIARERARGRILPAHMVGGIDNPLGARALYLGHTLYRIHGTNAPWTIGHNVSSGCIRMRNQDVIDLFGRVGVGTKVVVM